MVWIQPLLQEAPRGKWNSTWSIHRVPPPCCKEVASRGSRKISDNDCYEKIYKYSYLGKNIGQSQGWTLPRVIPALGNQLFRDFLSCRGLREGKKQPSGCTVSRGRDTEGWELQPQSTFTALQLLFGFLGSISAVQNSTDQGLQSLPRSKEPQKYWWWGWWGPTASSLLPNLALHCLCTGQGLPWR